MERKDTHTGGASSARRNVSFSFSLFFGVRRTVDAKKEEEEEGKRGGGRLMFKRWHSVSRRVTPSEEQNPTTRRRKGRALMKKTAPPSMAIRSDFNFARAHAREKEKDVAVLFQPFALTTSPDEREQKKKGGGRTRREEKVTVHFPPALFRANHPLHPSRCPESLSVSLVLSLFTARVTRVSPYNV